MTKPNCQCWIKDRRKNNRRRKDIEAIENTYHHHRDGSARTHGTQTGWWDKSWTTPWDNKDSFCPRCGIKAIVKEITK